MGGPGRKGWRKGRNLQGGRPSRSPPDLTRASPFPLPPPCRTHTLTRADTSLPSSWDILNTNAAGHGITTYLWDFYWWADAPKNPLLMRGLEEGFFNSPSSSLMTWAVMWANQDWSDLFPSKRLDPSPVRFPGAVNSSTFAQISQYWIDNYFVKDNYLTVSKGTDAGTTTCPLVSIYLVDGLVDGLGGVANTAAAFADFRQRATTAGFECVHIQAMGFGARGLPSPIPATLQQLGVDSVTDYCPQHIANMPTFPLTDYSAYMGGVINQYPALAEQVAPVPYAPNFGVAWDPSPRTVQSDLFDPWGYPATPILQPTVAEIQTALEASAAAVAATPACTGTGPGLCMLTVYAYSEFSEGGSVWPTVQDGYGRLLAFQSTFGNRSVEGGWGARGKGKGKGV
jgi:hypothetical protein